MVSNVAVENVEWAGRGIPNVHHANIHCDKEVVTSHILSELAPALSAAWNINVSRDEFEKRLGNLVKWLRRLREQQEKVDTPDTLISSPKPSGENSSQSKKP
jgi:hypothetical protein